MLNAGFTQERRTPTQTIVTHLKHNLKILLTHCAMYVYYIYYSLTQILSLIPKREKLVP